MTIDIKSMGYARVASTDPDAWKLFAGKVLGLAEVTRTCWRKPLLPDRRGLGPAGRLPLRRGPARVHRLELADHDALQAAREHLIKAGVEFAEEP